MTSLPADVAILVAAVADWRVEPSTKKLKKGDGPPKLKFVPNSTTSLPSSAPALERPRLLIGFAAETEKVVEHAIAKQIAKRADWIVANDVSGDVMGGHLNRVHLVTSDRRRGLARNEQGRSRAAPDCARCGIVTLNRRSGSRGRVEFGSHASSASHRRTGEASLPDRLQSQR